MDKTIRNIVFIVLSFLMINVTAQETDKEGEVFLENDFLENGSSIHVKWISKHVYFPEGVFVYRKTASSKWEKLNSTPITLKKTPVNGGASFDEDTRNLYEGVKALSYQEFQDNFIRAFVTIKAIYNNELAETIGIYFVDKSAKQGETYTYKVVGIENGREMEVGTKKINSGTYSKQAPPKDIVVDRKRKRIDITWEPELLRYYGVDVYRQSELESDYVKITKVPRAVQRVENREGEVVFPEVFFSDLEFDKKLTYKYKFVAIDYFGNESNESEPITAFAQDFDPPSPVNNLQVYPYAKDLIVKLSWDAVTEDDLYGYNVYRSRKLDGPYNKVNDEVVNGETEYEDIVVNPGGYYYYVSSIDFLGNESYSAKVFMDLKDIIPPKAPKGFKSYADTGMIKLSWNPNTEKDLKGYFVQRSLNDDDNSDNKYINVNSEPITATKFEQKIAKHVRNKFVYRVVAIDTSYNYSKPSVNSLAQMPDVVAPAIPVIKYIQPQENALRVEWLPNTDSDLKGYNVYRKGVTEESREEKMNYSLVPAGFKYYDIRKIIYDQKFEYYITSVDETGNESENSKPFSYTIKSKEDSAALAFEVKTKFNPKRKNVKLYWEDQEDIKGYVVFSSEDNATFKPITGLLNDINNFITSTESTEKYIQVRCYKKNGKKLISNTIELNK